MEKSHSSQNTILVIRVLYNICGEGKDQDNEGEKRQIALNIFKNYEKKPYHEGRLFESSAKRQ